MSYTSYDFPRRDSRTDVYRDDRYTYSTDRRTDHWTDRRTDSKTYYNHNYFQRYDYTRDERRSRDLSSRDRSSSRRSSSKEYSNRRPSSSRSRESRGHSRGEGGSSRPDDRRPRVSSHAEVELPEIPESIFYPDLWSTHMTDADYAQMAVWEDETRQSIQAEIRSTTQSVNTKATVSHAVSPPNNRKRRHDAASFTSNYTTDRQPLPKRPKIHVNRHFYHRYGYHY